MKTSLIKNSGRSMYPTSWYSPLFRNDFSNLWDRDIVATIPSINIAEEKDNYKIEMAIPGLKKENFDIQLNGDVITISGENESESNEEDKENNHYSRREYNYSSFSRSFTLPENTDKSKISAKYNNGILNVIVQKNPDALKKQDKKIEVL